MALTYYSVFAQISGNKVVGIVVGEAYSVLEAAMNSYGPEATIVKVSNPEYPLEIGDDYIDGKFYRNGNEIEPMPTENVRLSRAEARVSSHEATLGENAVDINDLNDAVIELASLIGG